MKSNVQFVLLVCALVISYMVAPSISKASDHYYVLADTAVSATEDSTYLQVDVPAEFPGGMDALVKFLGNNVRYPADARRSGEQGTVFVSFVVDRDGSIRDPSVVKGISLSLDDESLRVVALFPKWQPGKIKDAAVASRFVLPIKYKLSGGGGKSQKLRRSDWH